MYRVFFDSDPEEEEGEPPEWEHPAAPTSFGTRAWPLPSPIASDPGGIGVGSPLTSVTTMRLRFEQQIASGQSCPFDAHMED